MLAIGWELNIKGSAGATVWFEPFCTTSINVPDKLGPVTPVGRVKGGIGGNVGPIKFGFNTAAFKHSSSIEFCGFFYLT